VAVSAAWGASSRDDAEELVDADLVDDLVEVRPGGAPPPPPASGVKSLVVPHARESREGRDREFRTLYQDHVGFVWRNLRRLGVAERDIEDKVQEVFVVAHRRWASFEERGHGPRAWIFQILLRVASDARRHRRRHPVDPDGGVAEEGAFVDAPQTQLVANREALDVLDRALETIEVGRRAVLVLHEIEQMTAPEIARTLELPLNTVYSRLRVARVELEQELARAQREASEKALLVVRAASPARVNGERSR
jgi:RNA polymerase sigma-70 factor (ECF subfamily)